MNINYEKDVSIDENALDVELLQQAQLTFTYGSFSSRLNYELSKKKEELDLIKAELDKNIRNNHEEYGIAKITEAAINSAIITNKEYLEKNSEYLEIKYEYEVSLAAVRALNDKKSALENLVKLHGQQYFAGPSLPRDIGEEWLKKQKEKQISKKIKLQRTNK